MGPSFKDWMLLLGSLGFVAAGVWLLAVGDEPGKAIAATTFFGLCAAIAVLMLVEKRAVAKSLAVPGLVEALGNEPIRQRRSLLYGGGGALTGAGVVLLATGSGFGPLWLLCSAAIAGTGLALIAGTATGRLGRAWLAFEPEGLRIGARDHSYLVHWDNVRRVEIGDLRGNTVVLLEPAKLERVLATVTSEGEVSAAQKRLARQLGISLGFTGWPIAILPRQYGLDTALLARAIAGYATNPELRERLGRRALPG